jgi:predicted ATPase/DNA-binding SARP family transcriptional activator
MYFRVLGPVVAENDGAAVQLSTRQRLLMAVLVSRTGEIAGTDLLVDALWSDSPPRNPSAALQNIVSRFRMRLGEPDAGSLVTRPPGYGLFVDPEHVDRLEFERRLRAARSATDPEAALDAYRHALELWQGRAYAEFADNVALRADAAWLDETRVLAREEHLTLLARADRAAAIPELEVLAAEEPFRERPTALLMETLHRAGRQRDALHAYRTFRNRLAEELGLDPPRSLVELEEAILCDTLEPAPPQQRPAARASSGGNGNIVARRTSFVGRELEVATVRRHLEKARLVSLVGAGGVGKTSLALEAACGERTRFAHGVWVVDLLQLSDGARIAEHIATTIGLPALDEVDPAFSLVEHLRGRDLLIVLDNCEHVIDSAASVVDAIVDGCEGVRVLATTREPLRLPGELVWRLEPLAVPAAGSTSLAEVLEAPSGRLLIDRLRGADAALGLDDTDATLIATICRRLDGLPLAIELAAARVPALGLHEVADRLDDRFSVLSTNHRAALAHHQTLRAAIDWSVDLLDESQRGLLGRLSTFVGGFDLAAAVSVCASDDLPQRQVPDAVAALVERSLVVVERRNDGIRYRLLETIREYATELVVGSAPRDRHLLWCSELAHAIGDGFLVQTDRWYERLRTEFPNLRAAFRWAMDVGRVGEALDLAASLRWAPFNTGELYSEHRAWIEEALSAADVAAVGDRTIARGLVAAGAVTGLEGRSIDAVAMLERAVELLQALGDHEETVWCQMWLGAFQADLGEFDAAVEHTRVGLALAQAIGSPPITVYLANQHAENAMALGALLDDDRHRAVAAETYAMASELAREHSVGEGRVRAAHGAALLSAVEDPTGCLEQCQEHLVEWRQLGHGNRLIVALLSTARVAVLAGEPGVGAALIAETIEVIAQVGWKQALGRTLETAAVCSLQLGDASTAALLAGAASQRFLTPRWFVPIDAERRLGEGRSAGPGSWDLALRAGELMGDRAVMDLAASFG